MDTKQTNIKATVFRIWKYLDVYRKQLLLVLFLVLISSAFALLGPYVIGYAIDEYIAKDVTNHFGTIILLIVSVYFIFSISSFLQNYSMIGIGQKTVFTMRDQLFKQLHHLPISFFDKRQHGELMSRITNDIDNVSQTLNSSIIQIFSSVLTLIGTITMMLILSPTLTLVSMIVIPLMFFGMKWITKRTSRYFKKQQKHLGQLNGFIEETISGQKIVKAFSQEEKMINEFIDNNTKLKEAGYWAQTYSGFIPKLMNVLNNLSFAIIAGVGGYLALKGHISIGVIVVFTEYSRQFTRPLNDLANQFNTLLSAVAGAERVFEILDEKTIEEKKQYKTIANIDGEIIFDRVSFAYGTDKDTIEDITFQTKPGETTALVGPTGAGKSTVINLLARFYSINSGSIYIDGINLEQFHQDDIRQHLGFVLQDAYLFEGTVKDNIRYGLLEASDDEVVQAARLANAHDFIMSLPDQYETKLTQNGQGISQGQKQLISIARAMLRKPSILILDEATSNIDTITELKIQDALTRLMEGRTSIVIAHRLNTIQQANQIIVLDDGKMIEKGTHQSLIQQGGFYSDLVSHQFQQAN